MKSLLKVLCLAASAAPLFAQTVNPCAETTKLSTAASGVQTFTNNTSGNSSLGGSGNTAYGYEMWTEGGNSNKLIWYGPNQGGGMAYRAEWTNPNDYLGRIGFYWGNGSTYTTYKNIYADYNYTRSGRSTAGDYSYIGVYGWSRNNSASNANERLIEYYVVDDWFGNQWQADTDPMGTGTTGGSIISNFTVDGGTYDIIKNVRENKPSIDGTKTFTQIFSIRRSLRKCGTISLTEHFKKWESSGLTMGNLYEAKFLTEAGGGTGSLELSYLKMSQEDSPRSSGSGVSSSSRPSSSSVASSSSRPSSSSVASSSSRPSSSSVASSSSRPSSSSVASSSSITSSSSVISSSSTTSSSSEASSSSDSDGSSSSSDIQLSSSSNSISTPSSSSNSDNSPIRVLSSIPNAAFNVRAMSNGALLVESNAHAAIYLYDTKGNLAQKIQVSAGSSVVQTSVAAGLYVVKNLKTKQIQKVVVK